MSDYEVKNIPFVSIALYNKGVTNHCLNQINILYPDSKIYILCPKCDIVKFESLDLKNTLIIDEDHFIDGINKEHVFKLMNFNYSKKSHNYNQRSWYWAQILKMYCCFSTIIPNKYIIIEPDLILLNKIKFYNNDKVIFNKSQKPLLWEKIWITSFIKDIVGVENVKYGYVSEYMLFESKYVKEMLSVFGYTPSDIIHNLMDTLSNNDTYDLAEYAWYAHFMFKNYPEKVTTESIYYYRYAHHYYGYNIRKYDLAIFKKIWKLDAFCIEQYPTNYFYFVNIHRFISSIRYKFNYYGWLPFSVTPKQCPSWVSEYRYPIIWRLYENKSVEKTYRFIKSKLLKLSNI